MPTLMAAPSYRTSATIHLVELNYRLARNYAYQVLLLDEWRRANVELVCLNRSLGQSPEDDLLLQMQGIIAEYERAKLMGVVGAVSGMPHRVAP